MIPSKIPYDTNTTVLAALKFLWEAQESAPALREIPEFTFDLVEVARQLLANRMLDVYLTLVSTFNDTASTPDDVSSAGQHVVDLLTNLDTLLYTNENYLLSTWIADAKQWSHGNDSYATFLEFQARNQITLWGPTSQVGVLSDYASKQWAGLVGEYHVERYKSFISILVQLKASGEAYNATQVAQTMWDIGITWGTKTWGTEGGETWGTQGDPFEVVHTIMQRWA